MAARHKKAPAFQLYAKDIYAGTSELTSAEFGAYCRGIFWSWDNGPLPLDDNRRRRALLVDENEWLHIWGTLVHLWSRTDDGFVNQRLEEIRADQASFRAAKSTAGRASGRSRRKQRELSREQNRNITRTNTPTKSNPPISDLHSALEGEDARASVLDELTETADESPVSAEPPKWGPARARTASIIGLDTQHRLHCAPWAKAACDGGFCIPKFEWTAWEKRDRTGDAAAWRNSLRVFVESVMANEPPEVGDVPKEFWPRKFAEHFGTSQPRHASSPRPHVPTAAETRAALTYTRGQE